MLDARKRCLYLLVFLMIFDYVYRSRVAHCYLRDEVAVSGRITASFAFLCACKNRDVESNVRKRESEKENWTLYILHRVTTHKRPLEAFGVVNRRESVVVTVDLSVVSSSSVVVVATR